MRQETKLAIWRTLMILAALFALEAAVRYRWIDPFFMASPLQALEVLWSQIWDGQALVLTLVTLYEIAFALLVSTVAGLFAGFLLWRYRGLRAS